MNIQQLEYVVAVDRFKNFTRAADYCHVTQATLSAMVKKLEEELDIMIFDRKISPVVTTDVGLKLLKHANNILTEIEVLRESVKDTRQIMQGTLKIGIIPTVATTLLPIILKPLLDKYPHLKLDIQELTTLDIVEKLKLGILDIGILATPVREAKEIEEQLLFYESMMVYGVDSNEELYLEPTIFDAKKIWLLEEGHCFRDQAIKICNLQRKSNLPQNLQFQANSFETLVNLTQEFGGITLIPELYYQLLSEEKKLKTASFKLPLPVREISLVYYRPFAKLKVIENISEDIREKMKGRLMTENVKSHQLSIIGI